MSNSFVGLEGLYGIISWKNSDALPDLLAGVVMPDSSKVL